MEQTIYADVLWAVNFSMDFLALYLTDLILRLKFNVKRCIMAATLGAIYGVVSLLLDLRFLSGLFITALVGALMCVILNGFRGFGILAKECVVFLSANMLIGGGMTVVYEYFNTHGGADNILIYGKPETVEEQLPLAIFTVAGIVIAVFLLLFSRGVSKNNATKCVALNISHKGKVLTTSALQDSGNLLTEPISGLPVIILRKKAAEGLLSHSFLKTLTELSDVDELNVGEKIRFILYESVSGQGLIAAFKPDTILVNGINVSGWVAVSDKPNGKINGVYDAIVPSSLAH